MNRLLVFLFFFTATHLFAQKDTVYTSLSDALKFPDQVYRLNLSQADKIKDLNQLGDFRNLEYLDISLCGLKKIPKQVFYCRKLKFLDISINNLTELPREISELEMLEELDVSHNDLKKLPDEIALCSNLKKLHFLGNEMHDIRVDQFAGMASLRNLGCQVSTESLVKLSHVLPELQELMIYSESADLICMITSFEHLKSFKIVLLNNKFVPFTCSLQSLSELKWFEVETNDCCWPYIDLPQAEQDKIRKLLPPNCKLQGFESEIIRSDIELR